MIALNNIIYMAFRLAPFILLSFFTLSSLFNGDVKGLFFIAGLLIACSLTIFTADYAIRAGTVVTGNNPNPLCDAFALAGSNGRLSKNAPLSMAVFTYTLGFMGYIIGQYGLVKNYSSIITLVFLSVLIVAEGYWQLQYNCLGNPLLGLFFAIVIPGSFGALYSYLIDVSKLVSLQYFNGLSTKDTCSLGTTRKFRCTKVQT